MTKFLAKLQQLVVREEGATMVEYGLMVALIAVVSLVAVTTLGISVADMFNQVADGISGAASGG